MKRIIIEVEVESDQNSEIIRDEIEEAIFGHFESEQIQVTNCIVHPPREVS